MKDENSPTPSLPISPTDFLAGDALDDRIRDWIRDGEAAASIEQINARLKICCRCLHFRGNLCSRFGYGAVQQLDWVYALVRARTLRRRYRPRSCPLGRWDEKSGARDLGLGSRIEAGIADPDPLAPSP